MDNTPTRILVIEDADALRKDIIEMLTFEGFEVTGAPDGLEGVRSARAKRPDLIICDIMMPQMDGFGVLAELRKDGAGITIPFIFLTALSDKNEIRFGMNSGADDYLTKPFTAVELVSCVRQRLETKIERENLTKERLNELRENIILALPHELRTPLTGILGFSDILLMDANVMSSDKVAEMAQHIHSAAQRLYRLTENYVVYTQLEVLKTDSARVEAMRSFATVNPRSLIEDIAYQRAQYYHREADLELSVNDDVAIQMIEDNLKKLIEELTDNAFKFSQPGTSVQLAGVLYDDYYQLTITDYGRGMSQSEIEHIGAFMQFGRKYFEQQGSGFGLAIVTRSVQLHNGKFQIESVPDQYTRVTIQLPAVPAWEYDRDNVNS
ncbi:MAG: response regulator [Anaerolineaceae bacterium]|nr:response regulator [Anaerolineaceae bacterium]